MDLKRDRTVDLRGPVLLLLLGFAGLLCALWLGGRFGYLGYVFGPPLGAAAMLGILCAAAVAWVYVQNLLARGVPWLPACRNGCCQGGRLAGLGDYKPVWNEDWTVRGFRCRCGITYTKVGRRFMELAPDGSLKPYLIWRPLKGWLPDRE